MSKLSVMNSPAHVWTTGTDQPLDAAQTDALIEILSNDEHNRYFRFKFDKDRQIFLIAHVLLRVAISSQANCTPDSLEFKQNKHGRPELASAMADSQIKFNLTHTRGMAACVVTKNADCGIDAENRQRKNNNLLEIARKMFAESEINNLQTLSGDQQQKAFLSYWTLKEAYVKARGIGLSLPTKEIEFDIQNLENLSVRLGHQLEDDATSWNFVLKQPTPNHLLALAIKPLNGDNPAFEYHEVSPLDLLTQR